MFRFRLFGIRMVTVPEWMASLQPFPLNECLESSNCPAVRIQNDLSQGRDAEGDVGTVGAVNNNIGTFLKTQNLVTSSHQVIPLPFTFQKNFVFRLIQRQIDVTICVELPKWRSKQFGNMS